MSDHSKLIERWRGYELYRVTWGDVLYEYRLWAEWFLRPSKILLGTKPEDEQERRAIDTWHRFVLYHRQQRFGNAA